MNKTLLLLAAMMLVAPTYSLADGITDYNAHCAGCHGAHGNVQTEKARVLNMDVRRLSLKSSTKKKSEVVAIIQSGKGKMPSFNKELTGAQISAIADYVMTLRKK